ncbi:hypothetical protein NC653_038496 [Populus alba x Populus x berolinensis]|uniref:non-specific serine/threonine protein kinase n=1 Tax=Populus alba x Populus x berolinensis TaxID=444605 RepID=A0AAD6LH89_9ROSI|nr:hypothetical protein NC653_038496 [Populus alba x Populus x berolinensis]
MAVNKIQNHALNELVDPFLGFDKDFVVRRMVTSVADLAFRCLQQEREMRPTMEEVLETLKRMEKENYGAGKADVLDISEDDVGLLKHASSPLQLSADSMSDQFLGSTKPLKLDQAKLEKNRKVSDTALSLQQENRLKQVPSSVSNSTLFNDCSNKFVCGNISADFPFWGTGRPLACGIPELEIKCEDNIAKMNIDQVAYRVLDINQDDGILRIAREDYLVGLCPPQFVNSTFNPKVFESVAGYTNLTFIYGCVAAPIAMPVPGLFTCKINAVNYQSGYIQGGATGPGDCYGSVFVPVSNAELSPVVIMRDLEQSLKEGFEVRWKVDGEACRECNSSSGVCGIDSVTNQTTCYCPDQSSGSGTCAPPGSTPNADPAIPAPEKMQPHVFPAMSWFITFIAMIFVCGSTLVFADDDERYVNCSNSFDCGDIKGVGYPFWGSNRPEYCGYPELKLNCSDQDLEITIEKLTYKVLGIDYQARTLSVARKDYEVNICPTLILNTTWIPNLLNYTSDDHNITIYYGCPPQGAPSASPLLPQFPCNINATEMTGYFTAYANLSDLGSSASNLISYLATCSDSIKVPVRESALQQFFSAPNVTQLLEGLNQGFGLEWNAFNTLCDRCQLSGGQCGYNQTTTAFTCYCKDQPQQFSCQQSPPEAQSPTNDQSPRVNRKTDNLYLDSALSRTQDMSSSKLAAAQPLLIPPPMHPLTSTSSLLTLFLSLHLATSLPSNGISNLTNCNQNFSCGNLTNINYPFTGGLRPSHCGPPEFGLTCQDESVTILKANSLSYRVTQLDQTSQTLRLSRSDLDDDSPCTSQFTNATLDDRIFSLGASHGLYLFYGCKKINDSVMGSDQPPKTSRFPCDNDGVTEEGFFSIVYPYGTEYSFLNTFECQTNIQVPILGTQAKQLLDNGSLVGEVLKEGFDVSYSNPYSVNCTECYKNHPDGYCGFDTQLGKPICICNDKLCPGKKTKERPLLIGLSTAGAVVIGIFFGCWVLFVVQRRKRKSAQVKSKGLPVATPPSSKGLTTSTNLSQATTSLTSSKSYLEKGSTYFGVPVFSYSELEEATNCFDPSKELGDGGFGTVYYGVLKDGRVVAVKRLYENNMRRAEQFMNEIEILALNKIQNHALNELVDPFLGFDKDIAVRRMVTSVAELAFRCLQQDREMRPAMQEVLEALKRIEKENYGAGNAEVLDIRDDDVGLLKHAPPPMVKGERTVWLSSCELGWLSVPVQPRLSNEAFARLWWQKYWAMTPARFAIVLPV